MGKLGMILAAALIVLKPRDFLEIARTVEAMIADLRRAVDKLLATARDLEPSESEASSPSRNR